VADVSVRESEVLELVAGHLTNAEIAAQLVVSVRTVESHVSSLLRKLDVDDRRGLVAYAASHDAPGRRERPAVVGLPATFTSFIGRRQELDAVAAALANERLVTLTGMGGIGKTRLAGQVAASFPVSAAYFVDLIAVTPALLVGTLARAIGVVEQYGEPLLESVCAELASRPTLIVLDNCEHLLDAAAEVAERILLSCPASRLLATSREPLAIAGERVIPVGPLPVESAAAATQLFVSRADSAGAVLGEGDSAEVLEVCRRLEGIPLAIELAAARCALLGLDGLSAALGDRLRVLAGGRGVDSRHRSVVTVLDWSYELLSSEERRILRVAAVFHGAFLPTDVAAVWSGSGLLGGELSAEPMDLLLPELLGQLAAKSLVVNVAGPRATAYRLLETVREYGVRRLEDEGELAQVREGHLVWATARAAELLARLAQVEDIREADDEIDADLDDLRAALSWGCREATTTAPEVARALAESLGRLTYARRLFTEGREHFTTAADLATDDAQAGRHLLEAGHAASVLLQGEIAYELFTAAAGRARAGGDASTAVIALSLMAERPMRMAALFGSLLPLEERRRLLAEAELLAPSASASARAHIAAAHAWVDSGRSTTATLAGSQRAVEAATAADDPVVLADALDALASAARTQARHVESAQILITRAGLLTRLKPYEPRAGCEQIDIMHMALEGALELGDLARALEVTRSASQHPLFGGVQHMLRRGLVLVLTLSGEFAGAIDQARSMRASWERTGGAPAGWLAPAADLTAMACTLRREPEQAREWHEFAGVLRTNPAHPLEHFALARVAVHEGRWEDAAAIIAGREVLLSELSDAETQGAFDTGFEGYLEALEVEVWAVLGRPDFVERSAGVAAAHADNRWVAAGLLRARARRDGDLALMARAAESFGALGARFEAAATECALPGAAGDSALAVLRELGCGPPA
jgi:predicted ATPase/DNA-binding CsgD family transcriptional regulator